MSSLRFGTGLPAGGAIGRRPGGDKVYALGDSRTLDNFRNGAPSNGPLTVARLLSKRRIHFEKPDCNGVGGATTGEMLANQFPAALASDASILVLMGGTNDVLQGVSTAATLANLEAMVTAWTASAADRVVLMADECPAGPTYAGGNAARAAIRDFVRGRVRPSQGIYLWPSWEAIATSPDGLTAKADAYRDDLHWASGGSWAGGRAAWQVMAQLVAAIDHEQDAGVISGGNFIGSTLAAIGVTANNPNGAAITLESDGDGVNWIKVDFGAGILNPVVNLYRSSGTIPDGLTPGLNRAGWNMRCRVDAGHENLRIVQAELRRQSGAVLLTAAGDLANDGAFVGSAEHDTVGPIPGEAFDGMWYVDAAEFPPEATSWRWYTTIAGFSGEVTRGIVRMAMPQLRVA